MSWSFEYRALLGIKKEVIAVTIYGIRNPMVVFRALPEDTIRNSYVKNRTIGIWKPVKNNCKLVDSTTG